MVYAQWGWNFCLNLIYIQKMRKRIKEKSATNGITNRNHVQLVFNSPSSGRCVHRILCQIMDYHMIVCYRKPDLYSVGFVFLLLSAHYYYYCDAMMVPLLVLRCLLLTYVHVFFIPLYIFQFVQLCSRHSRSVIRN